MEDGRRNYWREGEKKRKEGEMMHLKRREGGRRKLLAP